MSKDKQIKDTVAINARVFREQYDALEKIIKYRTDRFETCNMTIVVREAVSEYIEKNKGVK